MNTRSKYGNSAPSAGSMADIAFLLLIFFLVSTTILQEEGLTLRLPPKTEDQAASEMHSRNLFKIAINSLDEILIQNEPRHDLQGLRIEVKTFVLNHGKDPDLSEGPEKAVISLKTNRGTSYHTFIAALDEIKAAYYEIYSDRAGITPQQFRNLNRSDPKERALYLQAKKGIPMNISIAEPTH